MNGFTLGCCVLVIMVVSTCDTYHTGRQHDEDGFEVEQKLPLIWTTVPVDHPRVRKLVPVIEHDRNIEVLQVLDASNRGVLIGVEWILIIRGRFKRQPSSPIVRCTVHIFERLIGSPLVQKLNCLPYKLVSI